MEDEDILFVDYDDEYLEEEYDDFRYLALDWGLSDYHVLVLSIRASLFKAGCLKHDSFGDINAKSD